GADGDVVRAVAQLTPARGGNLAACGRLAQRCDDPLAHFRRRLAGEGHGQDVRGVYAGTQQVDVALDEHTGLTSSRRRFERDVVARIDRAEASLTVARLDARLDGIVEHVSHRPRNPCGKPTDTRSTNR